MDQKTLWMKRIAPGLILLAGVLWGSMGLFVRKLNALGLSSMEIVALRVSVTSIALGLYLLLFQRRLLKIRIRDCWCFLGTGICSIVFFNACYFTAITLTSLSVAAVLLYTAPAIVMVLSCLLFGEKMTARKLMSLLMTLFGCVLVTGVLESGGDISGAGILAGLGAGLGYALYSIFGRYALEKGYHSLTITFYTFLTASIASLFTGNIGHVAAVALESSSMLLFCFAFGILCTVVPYLVYTIGLNYIENSRASILASIEPVTATVLGIFVFQEPVSLSEVVGMALVVGAFMVCRERDSGKN
jgi:drug/metabolite transporter (DMT)-like permease